MTLCSYVTSSVMWKIPYNIQLINTAKTNHYKHLEALCMKLSKANPARLHRFLVQVEQFTTPTLHTFNSPLSRTTQVSWYQTGKTDLDFTEARDSEWQWHQLGRMQACTSLQTDNHASTPPLTFLQAGCPSCRQTNSVKALKAQVEQFNTVN